MRNLLPLLLFFLIACNQPTTKQVVTKKTPPPEKGWEIIDQPDFSIQYPSTWDSKESHSAGYTINLNGPTLVLFSPPESSQDQFKENINLLVQDLRGKNINLDQYIEISEKQLPNIITNCKIIESKRIKNETDEYHKIICTGDQGIFHLTFEVYCWYFNDMAYVLTFTSEQNKFEQFKTTAEKILNSFVLKKRI